MIPARSALASSVLLGVALLVTGCGTVPSTQSEVAEGEQAPAFELVSTGGETLTHADVSGSGATLVDFWATWCIPCIEEMPELQALHEEYGDRGLAVVGIACHSDADDVRGEIEKRGVTYLNLLEGESITEAYAVTTFPALFLIDSEGRIRKRFDKARKEELAVWVEKVLEGRANEG
jgi:peroxiredoxin